MIRRRRRKPWLLSNRWLGSKNMLRTNNGGYPINFLSLLCKSLMTSCIPEHSITRGRIQGICVSSTESVARLRRTVDR